MGLPTKFASKFPFFLKNSHFSILFYSIFSHENSNSHFESLYLVDDNRNKNHTLHNQQQHVQTQHIDYTNTNNTKLTTFLNMDVDPVLILTLVTLIVSLSNYTLSLLQAAAPRRNRHRINDGRLWKQMYRWRKDDKAWITHAGMTYSTFLYTLAQLKPLLEPNGEPTDVRQKPLKQRLLAVLNLFHTGCRQINFELNTGIPQQTISDWVEEIVGALEILEPHYIFLPETPEELQEIAEGFEHWGNSRLPLCVGAIDGTHVPVTSTDISYINCKGYKSINMQCVCDNNLMIRDVFGGFSGNMSDKIVFSRWEEEVGFVNYISTCVPGKMIDGINCSYYLVGDGGYTLRPGCLIPFAGHGAGRLTPEKRDWNYWMSSTRICVEQTFGLLKGRWAILTTTHRMRYTPAKVQRIFTACCVLHNICLLHSDWYPRKNYVDHTPGSLYDASVPDYHMAEEHLTSTAKRQRNVILDHLYTAHLDNHNNIDLNVNIDYDGDLIN